MAQKINPLGFRLGTTQSHHSVWFEKPRNYSASLQEDQKIRKFFENSIQQYMDNYVKSCRIKVKNNEIKNRKKQKKWKAKKIFKPTLSYTGILRIEIKKEKEISTKTKRKMKRIFCYNIKNRKNEGISNKLRTKEFEEISTKLEIKYLMNFIIYFAIKIKENESTSLNIILKYITKSLIKTIKNSIKKSKKDEEIFNKSRPKKSNIRVIIYCTFIPLKEKEHDIWKKDLKKQYFYSNYNNFFVEFRMISKGRYSHPNLIALFIAYKLKERVPFRKITEEVIELAREVKDSKGIKIQISGRLEGADKARKVCKKQGSIPLHKINAKIDYCSHAIQTITGVLGLKIWIWKI